MTVPTREGAAVAPAPGTPAVPGTKAAAALRALADGGRLAAEYPAVVPLLAALVDGGDRPEAEIRADLQRCGRILARLDPHEVLARHPRTPLVTVALTGNAPALGPLADPLHAELARHGLLARTVTGEPGAWLRDLTTVDGPLRSARPDLTLCLLDPEAVFGSLPVPWTAEDAATACDELTARLDAVLEAHGEHGTGTLVLNTLPLPRTHSQQLLARDQRALLGAVWREFNAGLLRRAGTRPDTAVIDLDPLVAEGGPVHDPRLARYTGTPYGEELLAGYAREAGHVLRAQRGMTRKCLVLDADRTLWAGVLAEDGPEGIRADGGLRGLPHAALQRTARQLASQGVLLALSSKNDHEAVTAVLRDHPDMTLREADFTVVRANWDPKDGNLRAIAAALGTGTDSLVFADDSPTERALVRHALPGTAVLPFGTEPALYPDRLLRDGWFDAPRLTEEDRARPARYRQQGERARARAAAGSYTGYLRSLDTRIRISPPLPHERDRIAQLTLRTNRFNLTGSRLPTGPATGDGTLVLAVRVTDRVGDNGLVGAVLTRTAPDGLHLDGLWLSCRVLGREIEEGCAAALLAEAAARGLPAVHARYRPTARNAPAAAFYPSLGFAPQPPARTGPAGGDRRFRHDLRDLPPVPDHLTLTLTLDLRPGGCGEEPR
ncbi:HAD-IIIC family phosphatase [Streptomyces sp. NPDC097619]|uniref:HAD-IIIC family phosphatase n=1 Tax=Streptomyces sp. NPDC097619 TaxID=3157228 RepID=UPI003323A525